MQNDDITRKTNFDGKKFSNPTLARSSEKSFVQGLKMWYGTKHATWPESVPNVATPKLNLQPAANEVVVTYVNHVTFLLQLPGLNILTDPVWCKRASPFSWLGPKRVRMPGVKLEELPKIDLILVSHNHYDHLDAMTLKKLQRKFNPQILVAQGDGKLIRRLGYTNVVENNWWDIQQINSTTRIIYTPMQHWSARGLFDQYKSLWGSYVIEHNGKKIFFGGDGGYCNYFNEIHAKLGAMDLAFLGIGAYEPRWFMKNMHTNPDEAVRAHLDLHSKQTIGMHFGTFQLSAESIEQPLIDLRAAKLAHQVLDSKFSTMQEGETKIFAL